MLVAYTVPSRSFEASHDYEFRENVFLLDELVLVHLMQRWSKYQYTLIGVYHFKRIRSANLVSFKSYFII